MNHAIHLEAIVFAACIAAAKDDRNDQVVDERSACNADCCNPSGIVNVTLVTHILDLYEQVIGRIDIIFAAGIVLKSSSAPQVIECLAFRGVWVSHVPVKARHSFKCGKDSRQLLDVILVWQVTR